MSIQKKYILDMPPSLNSYLKKGKGRVYLSQEAIQYKEYIKKMFIHEQFNKDVFYSISIDIHPKILKKVHSDPFYFLSQRRHDVDNVTKVLFDALKDIVYHDDKQIIMMNIKINKPLHESGKI